MKISSRILMLGALVLAALGARARGADPVAAPKGYTVTLDVEVNEAGKPETVTLAKSEDDSTGAVLTKMAIAMVAKTEFPVRQKDGHAVKYKARVPYFFPIDDDEGPEANAAPKPRMKAGGAIQPAYPLAEAQKGEVGGAILELIIDAEGKVAKLTTLRASKPVFAESAEQAVKQWTFVPAMKDGKPVESRWRLAIVFESSDKMTDLKYRVAPRPSLGSFIVVHNENVPDAPPAQPGETPAVPATTPAAETPAKTP